MIIVTETTWNNMLNPDYLFEDTSDNTYIIRDALYPKIEKVLSTPEGSRQFGNLVGKYVNANTHALTTIGPTHQTVFGPNDKIGYYELFNTSEQEINGYVNTVVSKINDKARWKLIKNNPIFVLFYYVIRYFTIHKDSKQLNNALIITALAFYPSVYKRYFMYDPNPGVMQYTIDNLSQRFIIKKSNHIFGTLVFSIQGSWKFHEEGFKDGSDGEVIHFIRRIRNDQNSLLKKISQNYYDNYNKGLTVTTQVDSYEDNAIVDTENDSNRVESVTNKIVLQMIVNGIDLKICDFAANASNVSKIDLRNYLTKITTEKNSEDMKSLTESILFLYLYDEKHTFQDINSKAFISFALTTFKKTNSKNDNIINIKKLLDKFGTDSGIYGKFSRIATRVDYSKAIYLYFILSIQKYN